MLLSRTISTLVFLFSQLSRREEKTSQNHKANSFIPGPCLWDKDRGLGPCLRSVGDARRGLNTFKQSPENSGGQTSLACYSPEGHKESDTTKQQQRHHPAEGPDGHNVLSVNGNKLYEIKHQPKEGTSVQFSSVIQSYPTLCNPMDCSTPGLPVLHQLPEFTQTHVHRVSDAIQPCHPLSSPSPPALSLSQHHSLFQ